MRKNTRLPRASHHRFSPVFLKRLSSWLVLSTTLLATARVAEAVSVRYWDPDQNASNNNLATQAGLGGGGTWDTINPEWWDGSSASDVAWNNSGYDTAVFGGAQTVAENVNLPTTGVVVGQLVFNTSGYSFTGNATNTMTLQNATTTAVIVDANANATIGTGAQPSLIAAQGIIKTGGGTLTIVGNNSGVGGTVTLAAGTLALSGSTSAVGADNITLNYGTLQLLGSSSGFLDNNIILDGNATITVNNNGSGSSQTQYMGALTIGSNTLTVTNGNTYGLNFTGITTLNNAGSTISTNFNPAFGTYNGAGATTLANQVVGVGALNKTGSGTVFLMDPSDGSVFNSYTGGTNVFAGTLATGDIYAQFSSGPVVVYPAATVGIFGDQNFHTLDVSGKGLFLEGNNTGMGVLELDQNYGSIASGGNGPVGNISTSINNAVISPFGASLQLNVTTFTTDSLNMTLIGSTAAGNGKVFIGAANSVILIPSFVGGAVTPSADNIYRFGASAAAATAVTLGAANELTGSTSLIVGNPINDVQTMTYGSGTLVSEFGQNFTGPVTINFGSTLSTAGTPSGAVPNILGAGSVINIYGTLTDSGANGGGITPSQLTQTIFNLDNARATNAILTLDQTNSAFNSSAANARLQTSSILNLSGGTLNFLGNATDTITAQTVAAINAMSANVINVNASSGTVISKLTATALTRINHGTILFTATGTTTHFGDGRTVFLDGSLSPTTASNPIISPAFLETDTNTTAANQTLQFLSYSTSGGIAPVAYTAESTATGLAGLVNTAVADITAAITPTASSVYALRVRGGALAAGATITIGAAVTSPTDGAGLIFDQAAATSGVNFTFGSLSGTQGTQEAIIYVNTGDQTLSGLINATNLTKTGPNMLVLSSTANSTTGLSENPNLIGTIYINQGAFRPNTPGADNFLPIVINGGSLDLTNAGVTNGLFYDDVTVNGDSAINNGDSQQASIKSLTINGRQNSSDTNPITLTMDGIGVGQGAGGGLGVLGTTTLNTSVNFVINGNDARTQDYLDGVVSGIGAINKYGIKSIPLILANPGNTYSGGTNVYAGIVASQVGSTGTPFGSGAITVYPGGGVSIANPNNISNNILNLDSDLTGLAVLGLRFSSTATGTSPFPTGTINFNNGNIGGPYSGVLAIDAPDFSAAINMNNFGNGTAFLGSTLVPASLNAASTNSPIINGGYFTGALTPATYGTTLVPSNEVASPTGGAPILSSNSTVYRLGGGTPATSTTGYIYEGTLILAGASNQLTGSSDVQIGAISNVTQYASIQLNMGIGNGPHSQFQQSHQRQ